MQSPLFDQPFRCSVLLLGVALLTAWHPGPLSAQEPTDSIPLNRPAVTNQPASAEVEGAVRLLNEGRKGSARLSAGQLRLRHPKAFPQVTLVGFVTGNGGVILGSILIGGKPYQPNQAAELVLQQAGWEQAAAADRQRLGMLWIEEALLGFGDSVVRDKPRVEGKKLLSPPKESSLNDGGVRFVLWVKENQGHDLGTYYRRSYFLFGPRGQLVHNRVLDRVFVGES